MLSNIQAWEAAVAVSGAAERGYVASNRFLPYVPIDETEVSVDYLLHYFLSEDGLAALRRASPGTQVRNRTLGQRLFEHTDVPLPDCIEQRHIARHLEQFANCSMQIRESDDKYTLAGQTLLDSTISATTAPTRPMGDILRLAREPISIQRDETYETLGILNRARGVFARGSTAGSDTKYSQYFRIKANQLIYSKLFGWEGSVAIVPEKYHDYYVSAEFPSFDILESVALPQYVAHLIKWSGFTAQLNSTATGMGQRRQRTNISDFMAIEVPLPAISQQCRAVRHLDKISRVSKLVQRRAALAQALVPAARNAVFNSLR